MRNGGAVLRKRDVSKLLGVSETSLWRWQRDPSLQFPKPIQLGVSRVGWLEADIYSWLEARRSATKEGV
jgi:predicted DNA-binding transcriptional regulator AlpA